MPDDPSRRPALTISQLAERTGVAAGTLRMWEARHRFPVPERLPSGHRRYSERDAEVVRAVTRLRADGLSLEAAIGRAQDEHESRPRSIFAGLRARHPDLQPIALPKRTLIAASRAIEDEYLAGAGAGVLVGSFQQERFYRASERRWTEMARTAGVAIALADFPRLRSRAGRPHEVPIGPGHPLGREWAVVVHAPPTWACLAAWEIPEQRRPRDPERRFEVLWSAEPAAVRAALAVAARLVEVEAAGLATHLGGALERPAPPSTPELRSATALAQRMLAYVAGARP